MRAKETRRRLGGSEAGRGGFALPAAIGALVIIGVLVTAGFYVAQQEMRIGVATENAGMAFFLAERGAGEVMDNWDNAVMEAQALFAPTTFTGTADEGDWTVEVRRVGTQLYFLDASGTITEGGALYAGASRRIGMLARHLELGIDPPAAITTMGAVDFKGMGSVTGNDSDPPGWPGASCPAAPQNRIGLLTDDSTGVTTPGMGMSPPNPCGEFTGSPCVVEDVGWVDEVFDPFYDADYWDYLIDIADHRLASLSSFGPATAGGACDRSVPTNLGRPSDPSALCGDYFPLIYVSGDVSASGNYEGQGILLVEGDVQMTGTIDFVGLIVTKGEFGIGGTVQVHGSVIADDITVLNGTPDISYTYCGVEAAITNNSNVTRLRPITRRSFVDLTNLTN